MVKIDSVNAIPYNYIVSHVHESIKIFEYNLTQAKEVGYKKGIAFSSYNLGLAYYISGQYDKSTSAYVNAINLFDELNLTKDHAETLGEFGYQLKRRDLEKANQYMHEGIKLAEKNKLDTTLAKLYDNYGVLKEMEDKLDSAMYFYNRSLIIKKRLNDSLGIPYSLNKIAGIHSMNDNYDKALSIMKHSDEFRAKEDGDFGRIENLVMYGDIYKSKGKISRAIYYYEIALKKSKEQSINYLIRYCYQQLTQLYEQQGNYKKALDALNSFTAYKDSVLNEEVRLKIAELEIDYQTEKKDRLIAENRLEISQKNSQLYMLIAFTVILILISFAIFVYQKRKRERLILESKLRQAEFDNKLSEEKLRISRELHDNIGSQITFMISSIDNYIYKSKNDSDTLNKISEFGRDALKELRNTIWALKHVNANVNELILKVKELVQKINGALEDVNIAVQSNIKYSHTLSAVQMLNIYRVIQESIQNSIKHSNASQIKIIFEETIDQFILSVEDNGTGFDVNKIEAGTGLKNMMKRCNECGGSLKIDSSETGTTINCTVNIN